MRTVVNTSQCLLHGPGVAGFQPVVFSLPGGKHFHRIVSGQAASLVLPGIPTNLQPLIVDPTTTSQLAIKRRALALGRKKPVPVSNTHVLIISLVSMPGELWIALGRIHLPLEKGESSAPFSIDYKYLLPVPIQ